MNEFEREQPSYRLAETHFGDDLQAIAAREMGDANRWPELIWLNKLTHPYITDDPRLAGGSVIQSGSLIKIPAPVGVYTDDAASGQVFERDCQLVGKMLQVDVSGDIAVVAGIDNLKQQLTHRINTPTGQARRHPTYGCMVWRLHGMKGGIGNMLGAEYVQSSLLSDYRISNVTYAVAETSGDVLRVTASAETIAGSSVDVVT